MRIAIRFIPLFALPLVVLAGCAEPDYQAVTLTLPHGDETAGRAAFVELYCTACHTVAGEADLPAPVSSNLGPQLGGARGSRDPSAVVSSIVAPSHVLTGEVAEYYEGDLSPMGDYSEAMTVRQLLDLVAYLQSSGKAN